MNRVQAWAATSVVAGLTASCFGSVVSGGEGDSGDSGTCVPGQAANCACSGGKTFGTRTCNADGKGYGSCTGCAGSDASSTDASVGSDAPVHREVGPTEASPPADASDATRPDALRADGSARDAGCLAGAMSCNGDQPEACLVSGTWGNLGAPCSGSTPACLAGICVACTPGSTRCASGTLDSGAGTQACDAGGQWGSPVACSEPTPACGQSAGVATCCATVCSGACVDLQTDNAHCGGCGLACSTGCAAGRCLVTLASAQAAYAIAVDTTSVYWSDQGAATASVKKVPIGGGALSLLASGQTSPGAIVVDSASVYWTTDDGNVVSVPIDGGTPTTLASGQAGAGAIALDTTSVYWTTEQTCGQHCPVTGAIMTLPLGGGTPMTVASAPGPPNGIALNATDVYWTTLDGTLLNVPVAGGTPNTLAVGLNEFGAVAIDSTSVYWTLNAGPDVMKMPLGGGTPTTLATGQRDIWALAVDGTSVYWTTNQGTVVKVALGGGTPSTLTLGQGSGYGIAVDATSVYWAGGGNILKLTPK
jgi:hypothetical protein